MDYRERINDPEEAVRVSIEGILATTRTAIPAILQSFDPTTMTCVVQVAIQNKQRLPDESIIDVDIHVITHVPVQFPRGGGFSITLPLAEGDEGLLVVADRCIDAWWQNGANPQGGGQPQMDARMHDLSDSFFIPGITSQPRVLINISTNSLQVRSDDGQTYIDLASGKIQIVANEVNIHGRNKTTFDAGGTGFVYQVAQIDTYTDGVPSNDHAPNPPEVPT